MLRTAISKQAKKSFNFLIMFEIFKLNIKLIIVSFVVCFFISKHFCGLFSVILDFLEVKS